MEQVRRKDLDHALPFWAPVDSTYFVTVCAATRGRNHFCLPVIGKEILESIAFRHAKGVWYCELALLMPDHIHLLLNLPEERELAATVGAWKKWLRITEKMSWQENFFDHRIRGQESVSQKAEYILQNPVRADLVSKAGEWPYLWMPRGA